MVLGAPHGIARYAFYVASGVARLRPDWEVGVWTHDARVWESVRQETPNLTPVVVEGRPFSLREQWTLPRSAARFGANLVHFCSMAVPVCLPPRSLVSIHDLIPYHFPSTLLHRPLIRYLWAPVFRRAQRILCGAQFTRRDLQSCLKIKDERIRVIDYGGLDKLPPRPSRAPQCMPARPYFLCVSNPKPHKNLRALLQAFGPLESQCDLVIVAPAAPWLEEAMRGRPALRRLHGISDIDLAELYRQSLGAVIPSLYEGFGIPALEAMQLGTPVISSTATSLPEVVGDAALLFDPLDPCQLTRALWDLANSPELRRELTDRGLLQCQRFSWQKCAKEHVSVYEDLL